MCIYLSLEKICGSVNIYMFFLLFIFVSILVKPRPVTISGEYGTARMLTISWRPPSRLYLEGFHYELSYKSEWNNITMVPYFVPIIELVMYAVFKIVLKIFENYSFYP